MSPRSPLVAAAVLAGLLVLAGAASARARTGQGPLAGLNAIRTQLGLAQLERNPIADRLVAEIAAGDVQDRLPETLDSQPDCAVCEVVFDQKGLSADPRDLYASRGGTGTIGFALWRAGWSAERNLSVFFRASALALDPRAQTYSAAATPRGMLVVGITIDPGAPFARAVRWPRGLVDPRTQLWIEVLFPPKGRGEPRLVERRGAREVTVAHPLADAPGLAGARLVAFGLNTTLAYGRHYVARAGADAVTVSTRPAPAAFLRRSWRFASVSPTERRAFLQIVRRGPPLLRRIAAELDGAVRVVGRGGRCSVADACEHLDGDTVTLSFRRLRPFVVLHELGHAVFDLGLDEPGRRLFLAAFVRAGWRGECCIPPSEVFADQLAFWALGGKPAGVSSYVDRVLLARARFERLLRENVAYRPAPVTGPLKR